MAKKRKLNLNDLLRDDFSFAGEGSARTATESGVAPWEDVFTELSASPVPQSLADFSNVQEPVVEEPALPTEKPTAPELSLVGRLLGMYGPGASQLGTAAEKVATGARLQRTQEAIGDVGSRVEGLGSFFSSGEVSPRARALGLETIFAEEQERAAAAREAKRPDDIKRLTELQERARELEARSEALSEGLSPALSRVAGVAGSVVGRPEQIAPTIAGITGTVVGGTLTAPTGGWGAPVGGVGLSAVASVPMAKDLLEESYFAAKNFARDENGNSLVTDDEAMAYASGLTAIEFGSEVASGAVGGAWSLGRKFLQGLGKNATRESAEAALKGVVESRLKRVAKGQAAEQFGEQVSNAGQEVFQNLAEDRLFEDEQANSALKKLNEETAATRWDSALDTAIATAMQAGPSQTVAAHLSHAAEMGKRQSDAASSGVLGALSERNRNAVELTVEEEPAAGESQLDSLRRQGAERRKQAEIDAAYAQREAEQQAVREQELNIDEEIAATQKEVEEEAGFRTIERDAAAPSDRVERLPDGTVERIPVQPAAPVTAEQVVAEQELSALERRAKEQENEKLRRRSVLEGRLSSREKKAAAAEQKKSDAELKAQVVREQQIADSVLDDMPNATPNEIEAEFNRRLNEPVAPAVEAPVVSDTQKRVEEKLKKEQASAEARQTRTTNARRDAAIAAARRENPEATPAEIAAIADAKLAGTEETAAPIANETARERARQMGLGMVPQLPNRAEFGDAAADRMRPDIGGLDLSFAGHQVNQERIRRALEYARVWLDANPDARRVLIENAGKISVQVVGGTADPSRNQQARGDLDLLFDEGYEADGRIDPDLQAALRGLQIAINTESSSRGYSDMQAMFGVPDGHGPTHDISAAFRELVEGKADRQKARQRVEQDVTGQLADTEATPAIPRSEDARARAKQMGLGMAGQEAAAHSGLPESDVEGLRRIGEAGRSIAARQTKESVGVENLLAQGKLVITTNGEFVGRENTGRAGEYDPSTNRMYIYLDNLGDKDIVQGILEEIGTHESTHLGSFNSREGRSAVMSALMGDGDVAGAAQRIREAARSGNKIAQAAESFIPEGERDGAVGDLELLAYFTNAVRKNRGGTLGSLRGVASDMVANVRGVLRDKVGLDLDININDLASAVSDVTTEAARTDTSGPANKVEGFNDQPLDSTLGMIAGNKARNAEQARAEGRVRRIAGLPDSKERWEFPDVDAELDPDNLRAVDAITSTRKGARAQLQDLLNHPRLFEEYPQLRNYILSVSDLGGSTKGRFHRGRERIDLDSDLLSRALNNPNEIASESELGLTNYEFARAVLLHEVQHTIQDIEGFTGGSSYNSAAVSRALDARNSAMQEYNDYLIMWRDQLDNVVNSLPEEAQQEWQNILANGPELSPAGQARLFLQSGLGEQSPVSRYRMSASRFAGIDSAKNEGQKNYVATKEKASKDYLNVHGEVEARNTERRSRMSQEELDAVPAENTYDVELEDIVGENGRGPVQSTSLGMSSPVGTPAFDSWFGDSVVTNEDGTPRTVYTGTSKDVDFKSFKVPKNGVWFSADPKIASDYAKDNDSMGAKYVSGRGFVDTNTSSRVFPVYLSIQNPYVPTDADLAAMNVQNYKRAQGALFDRLRAQGYDGVDFGDGTYVVIGQPSQIKSVNNSGAYSSRNKDVLGMASPVQKAKDIVEAKGNKERLFRLLRHQRNSNAADVAGAESIFAQWRRAEAGFTGNMEQLNEQANRALSGEMSDAEWNTFQKQFPDFAPIVKDFRDIADDNAKDIVRELLRNAELNNRELNAEENRLINKLLDNLGKYTHRAYSTLQQGVVGDTARKNRLKALDLLRDNAKNIPRKLREDYDTVVRAAKYLSERLTIPDDAEMEMSNMNSLATLYDTWVGDSSQLAYDKEGGNQAKKDALVAALSARRDLVTKAAIDDKAYEAIETLMGKHDDSPYARMSRGALKDTGVLKKRERIGPEIRELLGEFTDPASRVLVTLAEQSGWLARQRMLADLAETGEGTLVASPDRVAEEGRGDFTEKLEGPQYGPLNGWYATPEAAKHVKDLQTITHTWAEAVSMFGHAPYLLMGKALKAAGTGLGTVGRNVKALTVKWNPFAWIRDAAGSGLFLVQNGNYHVGSYAKGREGAVDYIAAAWSGNVTELLDDVVRYAGVESARIGEIQKVLGEDLARVLSGKSMPRTNSVLQKIRKANRATTAARAMTDGWARIANYVARVQDLSEFYEKAGIEKTAEEIKREAGEDTSFTNIAYDRVNNYVRGIERTGASMYFPYMTEVFRVSATNYLQAYKDAKRASDPSLPPAAANKMLGMAMARFAGNTLALSTPLILGGALSALLGDDEDEWKRMMVSDINRPQDLRYTGLNAEGMPTYMPFGQLDPLGPVTDLYRTLNTTPGDASDKAKAVAAQMADLYIEPTWMARLYRAATGSIPDPAIERSMPSLYKPTQDFLTEAGASYGAVRRSAFAAETFLPGMIKAWDPRSAPGDEGNVADSILNVAGARYENLNPQARVDSLYFEQDGLRSKAHNELNVAIANDPNLTEAKMKGLLLDFHQSEMERLRDVWKMRRSLEAWGQDEATIQEMLKKARFSKRDIEAVYSSDPKATISLQSLRQYVDNKRGQKSEREERGAVYQENLRKLKASREWLASLGIELEN